jgi:hypothetical protein
LSQQPRPPVIQVGPSPTRKPSWLLIALALAVLSLGAFSVIILPLVTTERLTPVDGAFGFKLGEKLPDELSSKIRYPSELQPTYTFRASRELPPFTEVTLYLLEDRRIYKISAIGDLLAYPHEPLADCSERLISVLSEKYGLRQHLQHGGQRVFGSPDYPLRELSTDYYYFGTEERGAELTIYGVNYHLTYLDKNLEQVLADSIKATREKNSAVKKPALENGL